MYVRKVETKKGKAWEAVGEGPADPVTGRRKQIKRRGKTQKEAKKRVEQAIRSLSEDKIDESIANRVTFEMAAKHWLDVYTLTGVKRSTIRIREKEVRILNNHMAKVPIGKITHSRYQRFINEISPDYARTTVQGVNTTARMVFKQAIKDRVIKEDPTMDVVVPKRRKTVEEIENDKIEKKYLDREELEQFLDAVKEHGLKLDKERFYLLAFSGMRSGELLALKWSDINFKTREIRITKTLYNENGKMSEYELTPPKTEGSIRTIVMEQEIMDMLKAHQKQQVKNKMKYRHEIEEYHDGNFVFCHPNGYPFIHKNLNTRMERLLQYTSITKNATPHIFRHSHISMMTEAGIDISSIMKRVGHEDIKTTMKIYTHVTEKMKKDASAKVRNIYENALSDLN
ncbi:site-specific integrase [Gracilibacillus sp. YIM 98692]|uniref:tyrosine-type recombinase/integrase n=1 Tax=Gracilibacillus sp. YIM 98692 TaxID=2663532 RepID=UPI0013D4808C|nr:site-specific integrase [Gracilibacillus sp. YIM 98692]